VDVVAPIPPLLLIGIAVVVVIAVAIGVAWVVMEARERPE
jgi:hypothetical protein